MRKPVTIAACAVFLVASATTAGFAQEEYTVGVTAAITGPIAQVYEPIVDGIRIFLDDVNAKGGIHGRKIKLVVRDDQSEASKGAANARRLLQQDSVHLFVNASTSATYQPSIAEAKSAKVPLIFVGVCPPDVYPPASELLFCTNSFASRYDSRAALDFIKELSDNKTASVGLVSMVIPVARAEIDYAEQRAKDIGLRPAEKVLLPPGTADFAPYSTKLNSAKPDWMWSYTAWDLQTGVFESARRLGWTGRHLGWSQIQAEDGLPELKDPNFYTIGTNTYFFESLPVHKEIEAAAKAAGIKYPASRLADGWIAGMVIEAALRNAGGSPSAERINAAMGSLTVDTKGLRGGPIEWTKTNHFRKTQYYRIYRWNNSKLEAVGGWRPYNLE